MVVWDIMGYEGPSVGKTSIQTGQITDEKVQEIETAKFETRVMNKIGVQNNVLATSFSRNVINYVKPPFSVTALISSFIKTIVIIIAISSGSFFQ